MNKDNFEHVLRALADMIADSAIFDGQLILFGSQAILAHMDPAYFDQMPLVFVSAEVDVAADTPDSTEQTRLADFINKNIGEASRFDLTHGAYADGVALETPVFPSGWRGRLVQVDIPDTPEGTYSALSVRDIVASKLYAGREKDFAFVQDLLASRHPDLLQVPGALGELPDDAKSRKARLVWTERYQPQIQSWITQSKKPTP